MSRNQTKTRRPSHAVYIVEGEGESAFWTKVGAAWQHADGEGLNLTLTALPLNGRLVIRPQKAGDEQPNGKAGR